MSSTPPPTSDAAAAGPAAPSPAPYRVLMVDDQKLVGTLFRRLLAAHPEFVFEFCPDASAAVAVAEAFRPAVILQDLVMDEVDGLEMVRRYRSLPATAMVPVIMLSAMEGGDVKAELLESGANDYLVKPPNEVELIARLRVHSDAFLRRLERDQAFRDLEAEREKSEQLLLNILPATIAQRLKTHERTIADRFAAVTVLFSDLAGFTQFSQTADAEHLVGLLDRIFSLFDQFAIDHGVEKIKTTGDAYMAVAGLPEPRADHAEAVAEMVIGMRDGFAALMREQGLDLAVRIGMHSGSVVAGVIGKHKFTYDLWGDTVNIASRMESHGEKGMIHVSQSTRDVLEGRYAFVDSGEVMVKGKAPPSSSAASDGAPGTRPGRIARASEHLSQTVIRLDRPAHEGAAELRPPRQGLPGGRGLRGDVPLVLLVIVAGHRPESIRVILGLILPVGLVQADDVGTCREREAVVVAGDLLGMREAKAAEVEEPQRMHPVDGVV